MTTPQAKTKRVRPSSSSPPTVNKKNKDNPTQVCPVCESTIVDDDELNEGEDAIFCEGECQIWLHRKCVGLTKNAFTLISSSKEPYLCPYCSNNHYKKEVNELKELVKSLTDRLSTLEQQSCSADSASITDSALNQASDQPSSNQLNQSNPPAKPTAHQSGTLVAKKHPTNLPDNPVDRKFNLVIYGIKENPKGTQRRARTKLDIEACVQVLKQADDDISVQSVRDCIRLGKFNPSGTRPRPLLVKLTRIFDVDTVLYNRSNISDGIMVKPDMNHDERLRESLLLKERWSLITSGIDKRHIKIRGTKLFVKDQLHGEITDSVFVPKQQTNEVNSPNNNAAMELGERPPSHSN